ncbi:ComEC/Rec2 family competence protein [Akkermansia sp. AKK6]
MEQERHLRRPWLERTLAAAPLLAPALAMLSACAAVDVSPWLWVPCLCLVALPCLFRAPGMSLLALALAVWAGASLLAYDREYRAIPVEAGQRFTAAGAVYSASGRSALFRPDGSRWFYTVSARDGACPLVIGRRYRVEGETYLLQAPCGPGIFDRERWGYLRGIAAGVRLDQSFNLGEGDWRSRVQAVSLGFREEAGELLREGAPPGDEARQVMVSAVLGDKTDASPETMAKFLMSGCMHVFAVSGMHVGVAALLILGMLRLLCVRPAVARLACLPLLALYVFITGMSVSALRAFIMAAVWLVAPVLRRKGHPANILALAFILLCLLDPLQVFQPGFQLSFCVFAVIVCLAAWSRRERPLWAPDPFIPSRIYNAREKGLVHLEKACRGALLVSVGAWLVSIPLTAWHFGTWNLYAPLTNICLSVLVFPLMGVSLAGLMLAWCPWALSVCNAAAASLASVMLAVTGGVASLPCSYLPSQPHAAENEAVIVPLQKDAWSMAVSNPALVVDSGTEGMACYALIPVLKARGIQPAGVVATRKGKAERAGMETLLKEYPGVRNWGEAGAGDSPRKWRFRQGNELAVADLPEPLATGIHQDRCRVLAWTCRGRCVLIIGNAGFSSLGRAEEVPRADVLVIGRHPRDPVCSAAWIKATGARTVVFTTEYTCPVPEGVDVYRLRETGTLYLRLAEDGVRVTPWKGTERRTG